MNLKNYTSSVPVINSISNIEHKLSQAGATQIFKFIEKNNYELLLGGKNED